MKFLLSFIGKPWLLILLIINTHVLIAQPLSGIKTVDPLGAGSDNYLTLKAAVDSLNSRGVGAGGVTFNVVSGFTETAPVGGYIITATGTAADPVVFQKNGGGANPLITAFTPGISTSVDGIFKLAGSDYITIDGINLQENAANTDATTRMEWGYALVKKQSVAPFDGCQHVTIKNCTITLNKANTGSKGIYLGNHIATINTALTLTAVADANSYNTFLNNTISNVFVGISLNGYSNNTVYDLENKIGASGQGNTINNFGGAANAYGVYMIYQHNDTVRYNTIDNAGGGGAGNIGALYGIYHTTGTNSNFTATNNNITVTQASGSGATYAINSGVTGNADISNNTIQAATTVAVTGSFNFIYLTGGGVTEKINNNNFNNITISTTGTVYLIYVNNSTPNKTVSGNYITTQFTRTGTSSSAVQGIYAYVTPQPVLGTANIFNNNFSNMTFNSSTTCNIITYTTDVDHYENIYNNTISNITKTGTGALNGIESTWGHIKSIHHNTISKLSNAGTIYGIWAGSSSGGQSENVYNNTIDSLVSTGAASPVYGIYLGGIKDQTAYNNKIRNVIAMGATGAAYGIYAVSSTIATTMHNNMISNIYAPASSGVNAVNGVYVAGGTLVKAYFNTIYLDATSSSITDFGSAGVYANVTPTFEMSNNIIVNKSTPLGIGKSAAYQRSGTSLATFANASGTNVFYTLADLSNPIFFDGTNTDNTLADYKLRVAPRENSSIYENVPFVNTTTNPYNIHVSTSIATQVESNGVAITGITTDIDGNTRSVTTPDVGADEGTFVPIDIIGPNISYTPILNTISLTGQTLSGVTITDPSGLDTTVTNRPRLYFRSKTSANTYVDNTNATAGWKYVLASSNTAPFNFTINYALLNTPVFAGDTIEYFVIARDLATPAPNVGVNSGTFSFNPSSVVLSSANFPVTGTINRYAVISTFPANVTVGPGGTYPSISGVGGLFDALNGGILANDVTASVVASTMETGAIELREFTESGVGGYKLRIVPLAASEDSIVGTYAGGLIRFKQADRVTIDGSFNGSGKYLIFANYSTATSSVIQLNDNGTTNGCNDITIKNCQIVGGASGTGVHGISVGNGPGLAGNNHDFLTIDSNIIKRVHYGIRIIGTTGGVIDGLKIRGNSIGSDDAAQCIRYNGISVTRATAASVSANKIFNIITPSSFLTSPSGILLSTGVKNSKIDNNVIYAIKTLASGGYGALGISVNTSDVNSNDTISNNMISYLYSEAYSFTGYVGEYSNVGIHLIGTMGNILVAHNTVNLFGTISNITWTSGSANLYVGANISNLRVINNIFANSIVRSTAASRAYNIYCAAPNSAFTELNNNLYSYSGAQSRASYMVSVEYPTLALFKAANVFNVSSYNQDPVFYNDTNNLHINMGAATLIESKGQTIATITNDIDGDVRPGPVGSVNGGALASDIGADEFDGFPDLGDLTVPVVVFDSVSPPGGSCIPAAHTIHATITDPSAIDTAELYYSVNGGTSVMINMTQGTGNNYFATIPAQPVGSLVYYSIRAVDSSANHNKITVPGGNYMDAVFNVDATTDQDSIVLGASVQLTAVTPLSANVGMGTITNGYNTYPTPYSNYNYGAKHQFLVLASELTAAGLSAGPITGITFDVANTNSTGALDNFEIRMDTTSATNITTFKTISSAALYTNIAYIPANGINQHTFTTPYVWNGTSNLIIQVCNNNTGGFTNNSSVRQSATPFSSTVSYRSFSGTICTSTSVSSIANQRPNIGFVFQPVITYSWTQSANGGISATNIKAPVATPTTLGVKTYMVTANNGTCNYTDSIKVKVIAASVPVAKFGSNRQVGFEATTVVTMGDSSLNLPNTWKWTFTPNTVTYVNGTSSASKNPQVTFNNDGVYTVKLKVSNSAGSDSITKTNYITVLSVYCPSAAGQTADMDIGNVKIVNSLGKVLDNGIAFPVTNNPASVNLYTDYTNVPAANLIKYLSNTITVKPIWADIRYQEYISVYIDYNHDGDLTDAGELVAHGSIPTGTDSIVRNFAVPITAMNGPTLMRVIDQWAGTTATLPCAGYSWGETEDYVVNILPPPPGDYYPPDFGTAGVTPAPQCVATAHTVSVQITDTTGVDSAWIEWTLGGTPMPSIVMSHTGNIYSGVIPAQGGNSVVYMIRAKDLSVNKNEKTINGGKYQDEYLKVDAGIDNYIAANQSASLQASSSSLSSVLFTDIIQCKACNSETYPAYVSASDNDFIEITNVSSSPFNISGYQIIIAGGVNNTYTIPNGVIIPSGGTVLFSFSGTQVDAANNYYGMNAALTSSSIANGYILKSPGGLIIDVVATNGYTFQPSSGVNTSDWSGNIVSTSGQSGVTRVVSTDNNTSSDWAVAATTLVTPAVFNTGLTIITNTSTVTWTGGLFTTPQTGVTVTTPVHPLLGAYTYYATINDGTCTSKDSVIVNVISTPVVNIGPATGSICGTTSRILDAGNPGSTYQWKKDGVNFATTQTVAVTDPATYKVIVTNQVSLTDSDEIVLTAAAPFVYNAGADKEMCIGGTITLDAGAGYSSYLWTNNGNTLATTRTLQVTSIGDYVISVTNAAGCAEDDTISVTLVSTPPTVSLGADQTICASAPIALDAGNPGATYEWKKDGSVLSFATQTIQVGLAGTYIVKVSTVTGCIVMDTIVINNLPAPIVNLGADQNICAFVNVTLDAGNPGLTYAWYKDNILLPHTTQTFITSVPGEYVAKVTGANGCAGFDTVVITQKASPVVNLGANADICTSDTLTLDAGNAGSTYLWNTGATTQTIRASDAGTYSVVVTGANGCTGTDAITITNKPEPSAAFTFTCQTNLQVQFNVVPQTGSAYSWNFGDGGTSSQPNPVRLYTTSGPHMVTLTVTQVGTGCKATFVDTIDCTGVGIGNDVANEFHLSAAPNPFKDNVNIKYYISSDAVVSLEIYDMLGRKVKVLAENETQHANDYTYTLDNHFSEQANGLFFVKLTVNGQSVIMRLVRTQ
jgi:PKD repeat protein